MHRQGATHVLCMRSPRSFKRAKGKEGDLSNVFAPFALLFQPQQDRSMSPSTDVLISSLTFNEVEKLVSESHPVSQDGQGLHMEEQKEAQGNSSNSALFCGIRPDWSLSMVLNSFSRPCHNNPFTGDNRLKKFSCNTQSASRVERPGFVDSPLCVCFKDLCVTTGKARETKGSVLGSKSAIPISTHLQ
jgi:hypothetical protein